MTQITYRSSPTDPLVPQSGRAVRSEVVRENFQVLHNGSTLWSYDTVHRLDNALGENVSSVGVTATVNYPNHPFNLGDEVIVIGAVESEYNGVFAISNVLANSFDYTMAGDPTSPATTDSVIEIRKNNVLNVSGGPFFSAAVLADQESPVLDTAFGVGAPGDVAVALLQSTTSGILTWNYGAFVTPPAIPVAPALSAGNIAVALVHILYDMNNSASPTYLTGGLRAGAAVTLEASAAGTLVIVTHEDHALSTGMYARISRVSISQGDAASAYEGDSFHQITVIDENTYQYSVAAPFVVDSTAVAMSGEMFIDMRPIIGEGAGASSFSWSVPVDANVRPALVGDNIYDLGSPGQRFKDGYFGGKLTVDGGIDPTYLQLAPINPGLVSVPNGSFYIDSTDSNRLKFKESGSVVFSVNAFNAPATYHAEALSLANGLIDQIDLTGPASGSPTEEGLIVKVELTDVSTLGAGEVLVEIYNDQPRTTLVYSRVFDLADVPLVDTIPSHFESDNVAGTGAMYIDITNSTGSTGSFHVDVRTANILPESVPPAGSGTGIAGTEDGDGINWDSGNQRFEVDLTPTTSGLELTGATPDKTLQVRVGDGLQRTASGVEVNATVVRTSGDTVIIGAKRFDYGSGGTLGLIPAGTSGPPSSGTYVKGDFYLDADLILYQCTLSGSPGNWQFWGWSYNQGIDLGIIAGEDNASYTGIVTAGSSVKVQLSTGIDATADTGRRGIIRKLNIWGAVSGFTATDLDQTFRVACYPNEGYYGREQLWSVQGQIRTTYLTASMTGGLDNVAYVNSVATGAPDDLVRLRRLAATVGEEYGRITSRFTGTPRYSLDESILNSLNINDPFMLVTEFVELPWLNNSGIPTNRDKIFVEFFNDHPTQDIIFGYQFDNENIGGGPAI